MKNFIIILLTLFTIAGAVGVVHFYKEYNSALTEKNQLVQQNGELQVAIDAIGPITEVWTVNIETLAGAVVKEEELVKQTIPVSSVTDAYIMNKEDIIGKYYKVNLSPGVSITKDILMEEEMTEIVYERDLVFSYLPLGLKVGDYIDIRIVLPYGEEFVVIEHERVQQIVENTNTIKLILNESQLALWVSAMKDLALHREKGLSIYVTKYIEPGITDVAVPYYPVRKEMESSITINPNIKNKTICINSKLRDEIDTMITSVTEEDKSNLSSGVSSESSTINSSKGDYYEKDPTGSNKSDSSAVGDTNESNQSDEDVLDLNSTDTSGNTSNITDSQVDEAAGENALEEENSIN